MVRDATSRAAAASALRATCEVSPPPTTVTPDGPTGSDDALLATIGARDTSPAALSEAAPAGVKGDAAPGSNSERPIAGSPRSGPDGASEIILATSEGVSLFGASPAAERCAATGASGTRVTSALARATVRGAPSTLWAAGVSPMRPFRNDTIDDTADGVDGETGAPPALAALPAAPGSAPEWPGTAGDAPAAADSRAGSALRATSPIGLDDGVEGVPAKDGGVVMGGGPGGTALRLIGDAPGDEAP